MSEPITISELLRGCEIGYPQTCGYMSVIPLISELTDSRFTVPSRLHTSTLTYGTLEVHNPLKEGIGIMPFGGAVFVKQAAQNHAVGKAIPVKAGTTVMDDAAACIQSTQGGTIRKGENPISILPWLLKEPMFLVRNTKSYNKLWPAIGEFNKTLGLSSSGHLELYLERFKKELDEFIAEFEVVHNQVGAIVLLHGDVVGVERAPNYEFWKDVWTPLIRECYGSLVLQYRRKYGDSPVPPKIRRPLNIGKINTLIDLEKALVKASKEEEELAKDVVRSFIKDKFTSKTEHVEKLKSKASLSVESITNKQFTGQCIKDGEAVVYLSLFTSANWRKNQKWNEAKEFKV
jgi:hypothetical protein